MNVTATPPPNRNETSAELTISLKSQNYTGSRQSAIEDLISSELNQGAKVTVTAISESQATVLVCETTNGDLNNLLLAFDDGTFRGTVLDGAQVDSVKTNVECDISSADLYSSSSNISTVIVSEASGLASSFVLAFALVLLAALFLH